jgi:hypothetical protein
MCLKIVDTFRSGLAEMMHEGLVRCNMEGMTSIRMLERFCVKVREMHVAASINQAYTETGILDEPEEATILRLKPKTG